jgi:hypothetical protein
MGFLDARACCSKQARRTSPPRQVNTLTELVTELELVADYVLHASDDDDDPLQSTGNSDPIFEAGEKAIVKSFSQSQGRG